ncbi:hypothetical protein [Oleidesulfovibrio alaskensis]
MEFNYEKLEQFMDAPSFIVGRTFGFILSADGYDMYGDEEYHRQLYLDRVQNSLLDEMVQTKEIDLTHDELAEMFVMSVLG